MLSDGKSIFLDTLKFILSEEKYHNCISWCPDGNSFIVNNAQKFSEEVLPGFFKHKNFSSFHRQLNLYGFTRDKNDKFRRVFSHPFFSRSKPQLLKKIQKKNKVQELTENFISEEMSEEQFPKLVNRITEDNDVIKERLDFVGIALDKLRIDNLDLSLQCKFSTNQIDKANDAIAYIVRLIKQNPSLIDFLNPQKINHPRKKSDIEEIEEDI